MDSSSTTLRDLNAFEQQPNLYKLYTQLCYIFPVPHQDGYTRITDTLGSGLERLANAFPWTAGQVVCEGATTGSSGTYSVKPLHKSARLVIADLRTDPCAPTLEGLREAGHPVAMLNEDKIAPRKTLEMAFGNAGDPAEVLLVQASYISGGLLLTIAAQHNVMDMTGQAEITRLLSKACRCEAFTDEELENGNSGSAGVIDLLDDSVDVEQELANALAKPQLTQVTTIEDQVATPSSPPPPTECTWAFINFDAASLASIKATAMQSITSSFVSTDDALTALIWQATIRARSPRLSPSRSITFARAIDPRRFLNELSPKYPGLIQNMAYSTSNVQELTSASLGTVASWLRAAVDPETSNLERKTRALATLIHRSEDKSAINVTSSLNTSADIMLSSWAAVKCYDHDFGLGLGAPEMVRRPGFTPVEGLMYLLPKTLAGDVTAMFCLRCDDMERLKGDEEFVKFGKFVS